MYVAYISGLPKLRKGFSIVFSIMALFLLSVAGVLVLLLVLVVLAGVGLRRLRPHPKEPKMRAYRPPRANLSVEESVNLYNETCNSSPQISITITPPSEPSPRRLKTPLFTLTPKGQNVTISGLKFIHLKWAFDGIYAGLRRPTPVEENSLEDEDLSDIIIHGNTKNNNFLNGK
jgi:hypothetical protein